MDETEDHLDEIEEEAWLSSRDPRWLIESLPLKTWTERKGRLYCAACCRTIEGFVPDPRFAEVLDVSERFADGDADGFAMHAAIRTAQFMSGEPNPNDRAWINAHALPALVAAVSDPPEEYTCIELISPLRGLIARAESPYDSAAAGEVASAQALVELAELVRDLAGSLFRPVACDPSWRTSTAVGLASAIYDERAFDRLPILADALEEAGCANADVLAHCRGPGPHARGCWVVDLVLGKS